MKFTRNVRAISKLLFILLLLLATIVGAILSYLWVIGYFINLGSVVPEKTTVSITNVTFSPQDTSYFMVTLLNPSYSPTDANITQIAASPRDGFLYNVPPNETYPQLPYRLSKGEEETFRCIWNWANYTGETVKIIAFVASGSGPTFEAETPLVDLRITDLSFNPAISVTRFNVTVRNSPSSVTYVNITRVTIDREPIPAERVSISLPYTLDLGKSVSFTCTWDWSNYQDKEVTVAVHTLQGYVAYSTRLTRKPVNLTITNVLFNVTDTAHFNVTVNNSADSPTYVNITGITVAMENGTIQEITEVNPSLTPSYPLEPGANVTFRCSWNWTNYREKNAIITIHTLQDFTISSTQATTARVLLAITEILFDVADPSYFNVTVRNSEFSVEEYVNITRVSVAVENGAPENITIEPPITLNADASVTFKCVWNWAEYWNKKVSIGVHTLQGYSAYSIEVTPSPVMISDVLFNLSDTARFNVTVENSELFSTYVLITSITATLENGIVQDVTVTAPTRLPYVLHPNDSVVFECSWAWAEHYAENVTIVVNTLRGYVAHRTTLPAPVPIIIKVTDVLFDITDTAHFNVTVRNSEFSLEAANITKITVTMENGTILEITEIAPSLPRLLSSNSSAAFNCSWNWTNYRGKNATIAVYTLQSYTAYYTKATPDPVILILNVYFPTNTTYFNATVINSEYSITQVNITRISVTLQNGTSWNVTVEPPPSLPYTLYPKETVTFKCLWDWTAYQGETVIIKVETLEGYEVSGPFEVPS